MVKDGQVLALSYENIFYWEFLYTEIYLVFNLLTS